LELLLPGGRTLNDVFQIQLEEARKKAGRDEPLDGFTAALSVLPHPAPSVEVAALSGLTEAEVADICSDLAPGIRLAGEGIGFADEDFEEFIRTIAASHLPDVRSSRRSASFNGTTSINMPPCTWPRLCMPQAEAGNS